MFRGIKASLERFPVFRDILRQVYRFFVPLRPHALQDRIEKILKKANHVFFVQVGANDTIQGDPIHGLIRKHPEWKGMFIEPVGFVFQRLKAHYGASESYIFENVAIGAERGRRSFYFVSEDAKAAFGGDLPFWFDQLGSFDRNHILKFLGARIEPYIVEEQVECFSLMDILGMHNVSSVDLLSIDTEGYDYQILSQVDFRIHRPKIILYEHKHLTEDERAKARSLVREAGYRVSVLGGNTLAVLNK